MLQRKAKHSNTDVIVFIVVLSVVCALTLSILASALQKPQEVARELDRSRQMLLATRILHSNQYFQLRDGAGEYVFAKHEKGGKLEPFEKEVYATDEDVLAVYRKRIRSILVDDQGLVTTFAKEGIDETEYTSIHQKEGYSQLTLKLAYEILPNIGENPEGYVIPVNGYGLWDAIYGYIALATDGYTVIGIAWYDQKETPGLGAVISDPAWQSKFFDKKVLKGEISEGVDLTRVPVGVSVIRGKVSELYGDTPRAMSAVDGIPGATLTGNGVNQAFKDVLERYRPFLIRLYKQQGGSNDA